MLLLSAHRVKWGSPSPHLEFHYETFHHMKRCTPYAVEILNARVESRPQSCLVAFETREIKYASRTIDSGIEFLFHDRAK